MVLFSTRSSPCRSVMHIKKNTPQYSTTTCWCSYAKEVSGTIKWSVSWKEKNERFNIPSAETFHSLYVFI